jgi:hypothetical protein
MIEHFLIKPENMERTMRYGGLWIFGGFGLIGIVALGVPISGLPGMSAIMYGACCGAFHEYYHKPRTWLLALGASVVVIPCYILFVWLSIAVVTSLSWWAIDLLIGTSIFALTAKLLLSVIVYNWRITR